MKRERMAQPSWLKQLQFSKIRSFVRATNMGTISIFIHMHVKSKRIIELLVFIIIIMVWLELGQLDEIVGKLYNDNTFVCTGRVVILPYQLNSKSTASFVWKRDFGVWLFEKKEGHTILFFEITNLINNIEILYKRMTLTLTVSEIIFCHLIKQSNY